MSISPPRDSDDLDLRELLMGAVEASGRKLSDNWTHARYVQQDNEDALTDAWLDSGTSYIWRVGVLVFWDANKCDWCGLAIGQRREPDCTPEFKGLLYWDAGENDDPARVVKRALDAAASVHPVFVIND